MMVRYMSFLHSFCSIFVPRFDVSLQVSPSNHHLAADFAFVWRRWHMSSMVSMEPDVFVEVTWITEGSSTESTVQRLAIKEKKNVEQESFIQKQNKVLRC